ncbi:tetratricopeptide repeat protein [Geomobilimonas luticola]|uniref:Tetratricopeptide repeat protein n=1 Tax=Geomobilimonas luticola TaxID=1114878 RepID=A0ABS5SEF2_9BACT|nr:tetratricopeptide repeat protein [Geomobilimonas luticola]MBT0652996.1 tetratricopeptide repeat protein [Geomobilimonas luticola]
MLLRRIPLIVILCFVLALPASGGNLLQLPSDHLATAARHLKNHDYRGAQLAANHAPEGGLRDFLVGMAAAKSSEWDNAVPALARAGETFPLLADYALYHQANALFRLARYTECIPPLEKLLKEYPETHLTRSALLLIADARYETKDYPTALSAYQRFVDKYPSGSDSLTALLRTALCHESMGNQASAATIYRTIWLKYPAADVADDAYDRLQNLAGQGIVVAPFSSDELFRRGMTLYDMRRFDRAIKVFSAIPPDTLTTDVAQKLALKTAQAMVKARRYKDGEQALTKLLSTNPRKEIAAEATLWLARLQDKTGRDEAAIATFQKLTETFPQSDLADDALLEAAYIRKFQNRSPDALPLLQRLLREYPRSGLKHTAQWETAWATFLTADYPNAASLFQKLTSVESYRERALYWGGRSLAAAGDAVGAQAFFTPLLTEYPYGYYALMHRSAAKLPDDKPFNLQADVTDILPVPEGFDRVKTLIACGLYDEANRELALAKRKAGTKGKALLGIARLYLEMGNYNGALSTVKQERPDRFDKDNAVTWGLLYPCGFREIVAQQAASNDIGESLIHSIIRAESSYSPTARSPVGAIGLMQLMPSTAKVMSTPKNGPFTTNSLTTPDINIAYGTRHLKDLLEAYDGNQVYAVAAYNGGSGNVNRWRKTFGNLRQDEFIESIPFGETREYVKKVLAGASLYRRLYGLESPPVTGLPYRNLSSSGSPAT